MIHFEYDGASLMLFKVFDEDGHRLECCPRGSGRSPGPTRTRPAVVHFSSSSSSGGGAGGSSDSAELFATPMTTAEIDAFLADDSPKAYEKVVDRLLASPAYGEKWGIARRTVRSGGVPPM